MVATVGAVATGPAAAAPAKGGGPHITAVTTDPTTPFSLLSKANSDYVSTGSGGNSQLAANRTQLGTSEQFTLIKNTDGSYSLKASVNGKYVTAENAGNSPLIANRTAIGLWEKFTLVDNGDGTVSLRALVNNQFVNATGAGATGPLIANSATNTPAETRFFEAGIPVESNLQSQANNNNVTVNPGTSQLTASAPSTPNPPPAEQFALYDAGNGLYALRARTNGLFVSAENAGNSPLVANRTAIGLWETFTLVDNGNFTVSLRALVNNRYVTTTGGGDIGALIANSPTNTAFAQRFFLDNVPSTQNAALRSNANAGFVTAPTATPTSFLKADGTSLSAALTITVLEIGTGTVAFLDTPATAIRGALITGNGFRLERTTAMTDPTLEFRLVNNTDGTISLLCTTNGRYVTLTSLSVSSADVVASATDIGQAGKFVFINLA